MKRQRDMYYQIYIKYIKIYITQNITKLFGVHNNKFTYKKPYDTLNFRSGCLFQKTNSLCEY